MHSIYVNDPQLHVVYVQKMEKNDTHTCTWTQFSGLSKFNKNFDWLIRVDRGATNSNAKIQIFMTGLYLLSNFPGQIQTPQPCMTSQ